MVSMPVPGVIGLKMKMGEGRIVFSGEVKENRFYVDIDSNFVDVLATLDASK